MLVIAQSPLPSTVAVPRGTWQPVGPLKSATCMPASPVPKTVGVESCAGDPGCVPVIVADVGGVESSTYVIGPEQTVALPAVSTSRARIACVWLGASGTSTVKKPPPVTVPVAAGAPVQAASSTNSCTAALGSPKPFTSGELTFDGDTGVVEKIVGGEGALSSCA